VQGVPRIHFIFAVPPDQCLILLAKIETQTAPYAFKTIRADAPFHKGRRTKEEEATADNAELAVRAKPSYCNSTICRAKHVHLEFGECFIFL
jgi:hypothetical protein